MTLDLRNGHRSSSESSFLQSTVENGTAPTVYTKTLARQILLDANQTSNRTLGYKPNNGFGPSLNFTLTARYRHISIRVSGLSPAQTLGTHNFTLIHRLIGRRTEHVESARDQMVGVRSEGWGMWGMGGAMKPVDAFVLLW